MFDRQAAEDRLADMADRRERGICTVSGCPNAHENRTLERCREHGGVNPMPAKRHPSLQYHTWRNP
jgi:hypothetical protein